MNAARPETSLRDLESSALAQHDVRNRNAHILERDLHVTVRRVVVAEDRQVAQYLHTRRIARHEHHRLLSVPRTVRIGLAHENEYLAARIAGARRPPLATVNDVLIAVAND